MLLSRSSCLGCVELAASLLRLLPNLCVSKRHTLRPRMSRQHLLLTAAELQEILDAGAQQCSEPVVVWVGGVGEVGSGDGDGEEGGEGYGGPWRLQ